MLTQLAANGSFEEIAATLRDCESISTTEIANALSIAVMRGDHAIVRLLIESGANPNSEPTEVMTALCTAVESANLAMISLLVGLGAEINSQDASGWTALHQAVDLDSDGTWQTTGDPNGTRLIEHVLKLGADPTVADNRGSTPMDIAEDYGNLAGVELMTIFRKQP